MASDAVTWTGDKELRANIDRAIIAGGAASKAAIYAHALAIQKAAKINITDQKAVDTGRLRASIKIVSFQSGFAQSVGTDVKYAKAIEFGARPHFPPLAPIREWCRRHGIPEGFAYVIAKKISLHGLPARPYFLARIRDNWKDVPGDLK
jgi:phage gpG-like protein